MSDILKIIGLVAGIGVIFSFIILATYIAICFINKKFGLDVNGKPKQVVERSPQVVRIEMVGGHARIRDEQDEREKLIDTQPELQTPILADLPKIETSFGNKRIGASK